MAKYVYPAIFTKEENGSYSVEFPDLEGCVTCGDNWADALYMAQDVLAFTLYDYERDKKAVPTPSEHDSIKVSNGSFVNYVLCDTLEYQKRDNKAVKSMPLGCLLPMAQDNTLYREDYKR